MLFALIANTLFTFPIFAQPQVIKAPSYLYGEHNIYTYCQKLIELILTETESDYGPAQLQIDQYGTVGKRQFKNIRAGILDITWSLDVIGEKPDLVPIKIPLTAGLFGLRAFFISKGDLRFHHGLTESELQTLVATQSRLWVDFAILKSNNYTVIDSQKSSAFKIVQINYADYFPRSVAEITDELSVAQENGLVIEPNLLLSYPAALFFYVSQDNILLANRIRSGLMKLIETGEFNRFLHSQPFFKDAESLVKSRRIITLLNPFISNEGLRSLRNYQPKMLKGTAFEKLSDTLTP